MPDWWGNPAPVDTSEIDELVFREVRKLLLAPVEVLDADEADPGSIRNGGSGWPTLKREVKW